MCNRYKCVCVGERENDKSVSVSPSDCTLFPIERELSPGFYLTIITANNITLRYDQVIYIYISIELRDEILSEGNLFIYIYIYIYIEKRTEFFIIILLDTFIRWATHTTARTGYFRLATTAIGPKVKAFPDG